MKLHQLRYLVAIARSNLNISAAAQKLYTSQPGISKQLKLLEEELGVRLFNRNGRNLSHVTPAGRQIIAKAEAILQETRNIRALADEFRDDQRGTLSIATTHTQARYVLPKVVKEFRALYPSVTLHMHQGSPPQIAQMAASGEADFAIATEALELFEDLVMMPCYRWNRCAVVPPDHPLVDEKDLTLESLSNFPIVTYVFGFTGRFQLDEAFAARGLQPNVVFTAADADVIKTYVRLGLGIGIVARMAYDPTQDSDLVSMDVGHLFDSSITRLGFRRGTYLRAFMYDFMRLFAPHLDLRTVDQAAHSPHQDAVDRNFEGIDLPHY
jgi:LysR family cys regulon transcriptional activator